MVRSNREQEMDDLKKNAFLIYEINLPPSFWSIDSKPYRISNHIANNLFENFEGSSF